MLGTKTGGGRGGPPRDFQFGTGLVWPLPLVFAVEQLFKSPIWLVWEREELSL